MPSDVPNKPIVDFPAQSVIVDTLIRARTSSFVGTAKPIEPGTPFRPLNHSVSEAVQYANAIFLGQKMGADNEFQEVIWATVPATQDIYNYSVEYSGKTAAAPIFKRRYLELRDTYTPRADLSTFTGVFAVKITNGGTGYSTDPNNPPTVTITDGGSGVGATAIAITNNAGAVVKITLKSEGLAYTPATVHVAITDVVGGAGAGATATAIVQPVTCLLVDETAEPAPEPWGSLYLLVTRSYETLPGPLISGTHTDPESGIVTNYTKQITATNTVTSGKTGAGVINLVIQNPGTGFTGNPTLTFSAPSSGVTATGTATFTAASPVGKLAALVVGSPGTGFISQPTAGITDAGGGSGATATPVLSPVPLGSVALINPGSGFNDVPAVAVTDVGTGTGAVVQANLTATGIDSIVVDDGGSWSGAPTVNFTGGGGTGAAATAHVGGGVITSITIDSAGTGYTSRPTIFFTAGTGSGGAAHSVLASTTLASLSLLSTGNLYQNPSLAITGGGGTGATGTVLLQPTTLQSVTLNLPGTSYVTPVVTIAGGGGVGATASAIIASGTITATAITNPGSNYSKAPDVTISGGGGTGAVILAVLGSQSYVEREPLSALKDLVLRTTVDTSTFPANQIYQISFRVTHSGLGFSSLVIVNGTEGRIAVGLQEFNKNGGSGPALAYRLEMYLTDSQWAAFDLSTLGNFSVTGASQSSTMYLTHVDDNGTPSVHTFRPATIDYGTSAGLLEVTDQQKPYGYRKIDVIFMRNSV